MYYFQKQIILNEDQLVSKTDEEAPDYVAANATSAADDEEEELLHDLEDAVESLNLCKLIKYHLTCTKAQKSVEEWIIEAIKETVKKLESSGEIHRFNRDIAEARSRIGEKSPLLQTDDAGRDTKPPQSIPRKHEGFDNDIVAMEARLQVLIDDSAALQACYPRENGQHIAQQQKIVLQARNELQDKSADREPALMTSDDYHTFMGMVRDLLAWSSGLRRSLTSISEAASAQMVKTEHDNFKAEIGVAMLTEEHSAVGEVKEKIENVLTEIQKLHTAWVTDVHFYLRDVKQILASSTAKEIALSNTECGHIAKLIQDADEKITWMEKKRKLFSESKTKSSQLTEKIKLLQKHQALQVEIERHRPLITEVFTKGYRLVLKKHENSTQITASLNTLIKSWEELQFESWMISKGSKEARRILEFNNDVSKIEAWIRDDELLVSREDLVKDYEHCMELQKKLDNADSYMRESRIKKIYQMADKLCSEAGSEAPIIEAKKKEIGVKYRGLQEQFSVAVAGNMHAFQRDTDETQARIKEKLLIIDTADMGKDLKDAQELTKRLEGVAEYLSDMDKRNKDHKKEAASLTQKYPDMSPAVEEKMDMLASKLLKKLQATEADSLSWKDTLKTLEEQYAKFETSHHFKEVKMLTELLLQNMKEKSCVR